MYLICKMYPAYLVNISNTISQNHTCILDRKAPDFDLRNDLNSKILLQKMVAGYRQSCMAIPMNYASQCDRVFCGDSKRKINIKYFLIQAYNNNLSQVCRSVSLQVCKSASLQSAFVAHRPEGGSGERRTKAKLPVVGRDAKMLKKNMAATTSAAEDR